MRLFLRAISYSRGNGSDVLYGVLTQQEINESKVYSKQTTTIKQTSFHFFKYVLMNYNTDKRN